MSPDSHIRPEDFWIGLAVIVARIVSAPFRWTFGTAMFFYELIQCVGNEYRLERSRPEISHERE